MTQTIVDEVMLREPRLLVPRMQPLGPVRVDEASPLGRGVKHAFVFARWADAATRNTVFAPNGDDAVLSPIAEGMACRLNADVDTASLTTRPTVTSPWRPGASDFSVAALVVFRRAAATNDTAIVGVRDSAAGSATLNEWSLTGNYAATSTDYRCAFSCHSSTTNYGATDAAARSLNTPTLLVGTKQGQLLTLYKNGVSVGTNASGPTSINTTTVPLRIGHGLGDRLYSFNGDVLLFAMWNRALSAGDAAALWADPYQFLIPA